VKSGPILDVCPNCGAPLDVDEDGKCRWCRAHVRVQVPWSGPGGRYGQSSLVPDDVDDQSVAPFIYLTLATVGPLLAHENTVQAQVSAEPGLRQQIRLLSTSVGAAGARVRNAGLLKDSFDESLQVYTPEEIWTFDLAFDVIAMLGAIDGLRAGTRASLVDSLRSLDRTARLHTFKKDLKKAGQGPEALRDLRARVPRRTT
jgi:hypothetical protein